jgi:LysR family transcriptional regulator, transcriptional activator of nhaA
MNYHHLLYFWSVASYGTVTGAAKHLRLTPQTLSAQIRALERTFEQKLFERKGSRLELTEAGKTAFRYAEKIFSLGSELHETMRAGQGVQRVRLGLENTVPKVMVRRALGSLLSAPQSSIVVCSDGSKADLASRLVAQDIDVALTDGPIASSTREALSCQFLGDYPVGVYAAPKLAARLRDAFPKSLHAAPMLLPLDCSALRQRLDEWFATIGVTPETRAEIGDTALTEAMASDGAGAFVTALDAEAELSRLHGLELVGPAGALRERIFAAAIARSAKVGPIVFAVLEGARDLFGQSPSSRSSRTNAA